MKIKLFLLTLLLLFVSSVSVTYASYTSGAGTKVTANIPSKVDIRLFGYTAPFALVQATSVRVFAQVSSDKDGYFIIDPLPISQEAKEICLTTIDKEQRSGFPLCIGLPQIDKPTEIGPVLLSPTLSLSQGGLVQSQNIQAQASGTSLPGANLEIYFFENSGGKIGLIPVAEAKNIPKITTKTDKTGSFSINLPISKPLTFRLFARAYYDSDPTPKSQTLTYTVASYTTYWLRNVLPKIILFLIFVIAALYLLWEEKKNKKVSIAWAYFSETRLKPFAVRSRLKVRRIWYNFRGRLRKDRI